MGYSVHITRKKRWADDGGADISIEEWAAFIESDPEMRLQGFAEFVNPKTGENIRYENPGLAVWTGHSRDPVVFFDLRQGDVSVDPTDQEVFAKMSMIARHFKALVMGDEGELYDGQGRIVG